MSQAFRIVDDRTGRTLTVYGDVAPTPEEEKQLFDAYEKGTWRPKPAPKPFEITDPETKQTLTVYGDKGPTADEQKQLFAAYKAGTWKPKPAPKPPESKVIYTEDQMMRVARARAEKGETPEEIEAFIKQALENRASFRGREIPELKAYTPPAGYKPSAEEIRMRQQQELMALEQMAPQLTRAMMGGQSQPSQLMTPQESAQAAEEMAIKARQELGVPESLARTALAGGKVGDVGIKVGAPLAAAVATRNPYTMGMVGTAADFLVQARERLRGERPQGFSPLQAGVEGVLTAVVPPVMSVRGAAPATLRAAEGAVTRAGQTGAMIGAGELVQQMGGEKPADLEEVLDVATLGSLFGGAFGALEVAAPPIWAKISSKKPSEALKILRQEPKTPEIEKAITELESVVDLRREALQQRGREIETPSTFEGGMPRTITAREARTQQAVDAFINIPPEKRAEEAAKVFADETAQVQRRATAFAGEELKDVKDFEGVVGEVLAPRPVSRAAAIEEAVGIRPPVAAAEVPQGYSPAAPGAKGQVAPGERVELTREARAAQAMEAFEKLPPQSRAEESARILEEAAMQQDRAIANLAGRMEENFFQGRLGSEETSPTPDMDRVRKADQRLAELEKRPGKAAKETARVEAQKAEAMKGVPAEPEAAAPAAEPMPELSPQAQRMADRYGGANVGVLANLATGGGGFVVGWNTGEGLPPQERLARALAFGAGGAFTPTAIRRIIGMQGWANRVIKERGVGSGALNTDDPQTIAALSVKGAALVGEGVKNFAEWGDKMVREFGDSIRTRLKDIWVAGQEADIIPNKLVDKAPERPLRQYETPEFKKWFGKSKIAYEDGTPVVMYHGSSDLNAWHSGPRREKDFTVFKPNRQGLIFVTPDPYFASGYISPADRPFGDRARIYPLYARVENPFDYENPAHIRMLFGDKDYITAENVYPHGYTQGQKQVKEVFIRNVQDGDWKDIEFLSKKIRELGFDGLYVNEGGVKNLAVFDPIQLKSATGNRGTFSLRNKDIRGISTPAAMMPVAGAGAGAVAGASQGETPEEKLRYAALGAAAGAGAGAALVRGAKGMAGKGVKTAAAIPTAAEAPKMDPRIAGYITKQLAIPMGSFAGGFTYGYLENPDAPPEQRLLRGLQWAALAGGVGYAVAKRSLTAIANDQVPKDAPKKLAPGLPDEDEVLAKTRRVFTPDPTELTKEQKLLTTPQAKLLQAFQNIFRPLSKMEEALIGRGEGVLLGDAASMTAGSVGKAEAALYLVNEAQKELIPTVSKENLNDYLFYRRVVDRLKTDPEKRGVSDWTIGEAQNGLNRILREVGDDTFVKLEEFARVVQTSADEDLKLLVRSGRLSQSNYDEIKRMNEFYAPFYVMEYFSQMDGAIETMGGKALDTTQSVVKAVKGIKDEDFKLLDIMAGFQLNKMRAQVLADKNVVMRRMAELSRVDTEHRFMKDLGTKTQAKYSGEIPKGWEVVNYMEDGLQKKIAVLPEVAQAVKGMDTIRAGAFMTTLASFASPLRAGATGLNAGFQIVNIFKDAARLGIMSKYGVEKNPVDLFMFVGDLITGFTHSVRSNLLGDKSQLYLDFLKSGAARSTLASSLVPDALARAAQQGDDKLAASILKVPLRSFISGTEKFGNALEESIKLAGFRRGVRAERLGKLTGKAYDDALERIAYEVRNYAGSPDFSKHGTHGKALNVLFMFANARIQGTAADLRRIVGRTGDKERNAAVVRLAAGIGTATGYLWYLNNQPENVEDYNKRSLSERNAYFLWPRYTETGEPMYYINEEGQKVREYLRFPKFEVVGMTANVFEAGLNYAAKRDPKGITEMGKVALENLSPIPITGRNLQERMQSVASGLNPVFKAPLEIATNKSFFQHRDIVKQRLQGVRPEEQYLETTPKAFIDVARAMPEVAPDFLRSPLYLKQLTENFTGSMLTQFMRPQLEGRSSATTNPLVARFFAAPILDEQEDWDLINRYKTEQSTNNLLRQRAIDQYLKNSANYTPAQRMQSLAELLASDPERNAVALRDALRDRVLGITDKDKAIRSLPPEFRAQFLEERTRKMENPESRDAFYQEMIRKGLINRDTLKEIMLLRTAPEGKKTSMKEGKLYRDPTTGVMKIYRNGAFV